LRPSRIHDHAAALAERRRRLGAHLPDLVPLDVPFVWEVGCGHGHFLAAYAAAHPEERCVGIDISSDRISRANRKRERAKLKNLHFILAEGEDFVAALPAICRFSAIYILFPDPWPKRRHHKNRVLKPEFLSATAAVAKKGARLYFRTDHEPYFRAAAAIIRAHEDWKESDAESLPFEEPTVFEKRADRHFTLVAVRR
jgi:tRNA (guanine-N7-)-methyltransferase